jgi:hypothetical protein
MTNQQPARITIHYGFALLAIFAFLGTVVPTIFMFVAAGSSVDGTEGGDATAGIGTGFAIMWLLWGGMWTLIWAAFAINHTLKARKSTS